MRLRVVVALCLLACGNQEEPKTAQPAAASTTAPAATSAAPVASESAAPVASASAAPSATATAEPAAPTFTKSLKELLADAKSIKLTWREKLDTNEAKTVTIQAQSVKGIVDALGADQTPGGGSPAYMSTFSFRFEDAKGNPIATISLYASPTMSDSNKKYGRIDTADGKYGGIVVAKYEDLQKKLKALGVTLP